MDAVEKNVAEVNKWACCQEPERRVRLEAENTTLRAEVARLTTDLTEARAQHRACLAELRAIDEALGTNEGHSAVDHIKRLQVELQILEKTIGSQAYRIEELRRREEAWDKGYFAATKGGPYQNPHPEGSPEYCGYSFGWYAVGHERECKRLLAGIEDRDRLIEELLEVAGNVFPCVDLTEKKQGELSNWLSAKRAEWVALRAGNGTGETESDPCPCDRCPEGEPCGISGQEDCHQREEWDVREMQRQIRTSTGLGKPEPGKGKGNGESE